MAVVYQNLWPKTIACNAMVCNQNLPCKICTHVNIVEKFSIYKKLYHTYFCIFAFCLVFDISQRLNIMQIQMLILSANMVCSTQSLILTEVHVFSCNPLQQPPLSHKLLYQATNTNPLNTQSTRLHFCRFTMPPVVNNVCAVVNSITLNSNGQVC